MHIVTSSSFTHTGACLPGLSIPIFCSSLANTSLIRLPSNKFHKRMCNPPTQFVQAIEVYRTSHNRAIYWRCVTTQITAILKAILFETTEVIGGCRYNPSLLEWELQYFQKNLGFCHGILPMFPIWTILLFLYFWYLRDNLLKLSENQRFSANFKGNRS